MIHSNMTVFQDNATLFFFSILGLFQRERESTATVDET